VREKSSFAPLGLVGFSFLPTASAVSRILTRFAADNVE
jgi:hypothetical protein